MWVLWTIWETIEWNHTKENKCIIKGIIKWKNCFRNNKNCFSETIKMK